MVTLVYPFPYAYHIFVTVWTGNPHSNPCHRMWNADTNVATIGTAMSSPVDAVLNPDDKG